jgi:hypothetical protein
MLDLVRQIETPWSPYAVTFSRDGIRLANGGGSWYGHGGIMVRDSDRERTSWLDWMNVPAVAAHVRRSDLTHTTSPTAIPAVSCLCFSDDDRFLAASMWSSRWRYAPTMLFELDEAAFRPRGTFEHQGRATMTVGGQTFSVREDATPTGVLLHRGHLITRQHCTRLEVANALVVDQLPATLDVPSANHLQHLTHHRLVVVRDTAVTEAGGSYASARQPDGTYAPKPSKGLALRDLRIPDSPMTIVPVRDCARVTAIAALPGNDTFVTGGSHGQIDRWSWEGQWRQHRLRPAVTSKASPAAHGAEQIEAIVTLFDSDTLVAVSAGGELLVLRSNGQLESTSIPVPGSPRSLAAHPSQPRIAVGSKQGDCGKPKSTVALFDVGPG